MSPPYPNHGDSTHKGQPTGKISSYSSLEGWNKPPSSTAQAQSVPAPAPAPVAAASSEESASHQTVQSTSSGSAVEANTSGASLNGKNDLPQKAFVVPGEYLLKNPHATDIAYGASSHASPDRDPCGAFTGERVSRHASAQTVDRRTPQPTPVRATTLPGSHPAASEVDTRDAAYGVSSHAPAVEQVPGHAPAVEQVPGHAQAYPGAFHAPVRAATMPTARPPAPARELKCLKRTPEQILVLKHYYDTWKKNPSREERLVLVRQTGLPDENVERWFRDNRQRDTSHIPRSLPYNRGRQNFRLDDDQLAYLENYVDEHGKGMPSPSQRAQIAKDLDLDLDTGGSKTVYSWFRRAYGVVQPEQAVEDGEDRPR